MAESDARKRRIADLQASNEKREKALAAGGTPFPNIVPMIQSQALLRFVIGDDEDSRTEFDLIYQQVLAEMLDQFEVRAREVQLTAGVSGSVLRHPASRLHVAGENGQ